MRRLLDFVIISFLGFLLQACASGQGGAVSQAESKFPGGVPDYAFGILQSKENFSNIERAQSYFGLHSKTRSWQNINASERASALIIGLHAYYPLSVRWKLKNGREYILENIDIDFAMREFFKKNVLKLQWQREGRFKDEVGDFDPLLVHEIKDDTVLIKWVVRINHTPVHLRLTATGAAAKWDVSHEVHVAASFKGTPVSGIAFDKWYEILK